jgi:uncharacterized membrane protein YhaH (DUF805 family)
VFAWYTVVLRKYAVFSGRARRREYWYFVLTSGLISLSFSVMQAIVVANNGASDSPLFLASTSLYWLYALAVFVPSIAVAARRLHDTGRSGWLVLLCLVPIVGLIVIVWLASDSQPGNNKYGPSPKLDPVPAAAKSAPSNTSLEVVNCLACNQPFALYEPDPEPPYCSPHCRQSGNQSDNVETGLKAERSAECPLATGVRA